MGRTRKADTHLPQRLFFRHGGYHYVHVVNGQQVWEMLSRDEAPASEIARRLNALKAEERIKLFCDARAASEQLRSEIMSRDGHKCVYCGAVENLGIDHIIPYVSGGATLPFNLVCACTDCNASKGMGDPRELLFALIGLKEQLLSRALEILDKTLFIGQVAK